MQRALLIFALALSALSASAQYSGRTRRRGDTGFYFEGGRAIHIEAVNLAADDRTHSRVLVNFRASYDGLTFQRATLSGNSPFTANLTARAELLDDREVTVQRASQHDTVAVYSYGETNDNTRFVSGSMTLDAPAGRYTVTVIIEDGVSRQTLREFRQKITLRDFEKSPAISGPLVLAWADSVSARPMNLDGSAEFGTPCTIHLDVAANTTPVVRYVLMRFKDSDSTVFAHGDMRVGPGTQIALRDGKCCGVGPSPAWRFASRLQIPGDSLDIGEYSLHVIAVAGADTIAERFPLRVTWSTMPLSLTDVDYAIDAMRYLLTDGQLDTMRSGNHAERKIAFDAYWAAQDPSPGTVFNERQSEYFHRVDHAYFAFRRGMREEDDGMRTDRGKIYILFGPPTNTERSLLPNGPAQEIWTYANNVKKRFVFVDEQQNGNYRLIEVKDLN